MTGLATGRIGRATAARWALAAILALAVHGAPIGAWSFWGATELPPGFEDPPIAIELASLPSAPSLPEPEQDLTPGPQSSAQEETAPPPEEAKPEEATPLAIAPTPQDAEPEIVIPEKKPEAEPEKTPKPEVKKAEKPAKKPPVVKEAKRAPQEQRAARDSAPMRSNRSSDALASAVSGASSAAATAGYREIVKARLRGASQKLSFEYPSGTIVTITIARSGQVSGARIVSPSGKSELDSEALAMVRRASPFPPFPSEMKESSFTHTFRRNTRG